MGGGGGDRLAGRGHLQQTVKIMPQQRRTWSAVRAVPAYSRPWPQRHHARTGSGPRSTCGAGVELTAAVIPRTTWWCPSIQSLLPGHQPQGRDVRSPASAGHRAVDRDHTAERHQVDGSGAPLTSRSDQPAPQAEPTTRLGSGGQGHSGRIKAIEPPPASATPWRNRCGPSGTGGPQSSTPGVSSGRRFSPPRVRSRLRCCADGERQARILQAEVRRRRSDRLGGARQSDSKVLAYQYLRRCRRSPRRRQQGGWCRSSLLALKAGWGAVIQSLAGGGPLHAEGVGRKWWRGGAGCRARRGRPRRCRRVREAERQPVRPPHWPVVRCPGLGGSDQVPSVAERGRVAGTSALDGASRPGPAAQGGAADIQVITDPDDPDRRLPRPHQCCLRTR